MPKDISLLLRSTTGGAPIAVSGTQNADGTITMRVVDRVPDDRLAVMVLKNPSGGAPVEVFVTINNDGTVTIPEFKSPVLDGSLLFYNPGGGEPIKAPVVFQANGTIDLGNVSFEDNSDPIGDALRADCVAYWKMDEASGTRMDASGHEHSLSENNGTVLSVSGIAGQSAEFASDESGSPRLRNLQTYNLQECEIAFWFRVRIFPVGTNGSNEILKIGTAATDYIYIEIRPDGVGNTLHVFADTFSGILGGNEQEILSNITGWHFVDIYRASGTAYLSIDRGSFQAIANDTTSFGSEIYCGSPNVGVFNLDFDEVGIFSSALSIEQRDYLYNSGAGRTLYP